MLKRRLSQVLGAISKGWSVDTNDGPSPVSQLMVAVPAADADAVLASTALANGATTTISGTVSLTHPTKYRGLSITGNAVGITGSVVVTGRDWSGQTISETIVASGTQTILGNRPFRYVDIVVLPARNNASDELSVGISNKLGLYRPLVSSDADFLQLERKASGDSEFTVEGTLPTVDATYNTFLPDGGITASDSFRADYLTDIF